MQIKFKNFKFSLEINLIFLSIFLFAASLGINLVTFPTLLNSYQIQPSYIALSFTLECLGGILMSFVLSKLVSHLRIIPALKIASFTYAGIILSIYFYQCFYLWAMLAFSMGTMWFMYVVTRQSWLNMMLKDHQRGVALGIFSMLIAAGIGLGPIITRFSGAESYFSFIISATLTMSSLLCLLPLKRLPEPKIESQRISLIEFFKNNPRSFLARLCLDFQTFLLLTLTVIFGKRIGLSYEAAGLLITAFMLSSFTDILVGLSLKRFNAYSLIKFGFCGALCCFFSLIFIRNYSLLLSAYFIFGIFTACIFVSVFKVVNDDYKAEKLVAANATFQLIGSIGSVLGSLTGGILFGIFGEIAFPLTIMLSSAVYLTFLLFYDKKIN